VALQHSETFTKGMLISKGWDRSFQRHSPRLGIPYPNTSVKASSRHPVAIECNRIDLAVVSLEGNKAAAFRDAPHLGRSIIAARYDNIAMDFKAADTGLVAHENVFAVASPDIPDSESRISGPRYRSVGV